MKFKNIHPFIGWFLGWLIISLSSCQPVYEEEEDPNDHSSSIQVKARSSGPSHLSYPAYVYAFNEKGESVARQIVTGPDTAMELKLKPASYTLVAIAGVNDEYVWPEHPRMTDIITLKTGNRSGRALMMGRATVDVNAKSQTKNTITITLYNVVSLINVTIEKIPPSVKELKLELSPLCSALSFNGEYGQKGQKVEVNCFPESEGIWTAEPFYVFPGHSSQMVFTIILKDDTGTHTYGYTFKGCPQANAPFHIRGCFQGDITLEGTLLPSNWNAPIEALFDFGEGVHKNEKTDPNQDESSSIPPVSGEPVVGSIWNQGIVVATFSTDNNHQPHEILQLGLQEWTTLVHQVPAIIQAHATTDWHIPTPEEAKLLHQVFTETRLAAVNQLLSHQKGDLPLLDNKKRYLSDNNGTLFAFGFQVGSKYYLAGQTVKYKLRLVRRVRFSE